MSATKTTETKTIGTALDPKPSRLSGFLAVLYYEFIWNLRKKKTIGIFIIIFILATLSLALPPILSQYVLGRPLEANPNFVLNNTSMLFSGIFMFLLAVATSMNTISGEFEQGSIVPLLTKPVSRTIIFLGKVTASFVTLLAAYTALAVYITIGGIVIQGPQDNLALVPLGVLGLTMATMVWATLVLAMGTLSKSSIVAALGSFGIFLGLTIVGSLVAVFLGQATLLLYTPGAGPTASTRSCEGPLGPTGEINGTTAFATGTDALGNMLVNWWLYGGQTVNFCGFRFARNATETFTIASEKISTIALRDLTISIVYIVALLLISWFAFYKAQAAE